MPYWCAKCATEMWCEKNEVGIDVGMDLTYSTDMFSCKRCGTRILVASPSQKPIYDPERKKHPVHFTQGEGMVDNALDLRPVEEGDD